MGVFVVTGGTRGIGRKCAEHLVKAAKSVLIASRDGAVVQRTVDDLKQFGTVSGRTLDLADFGSVKAFADGLSKDSTKVSGIICNAGLLLNKHATNAQGIENTFAVNHVGHFLLVRSLTPLLEQNACVVIVSSALHDAKKEGGMFPRPDYGRPEEVAFVSSEDYNGRKAYTTSKLCNVLYGYELGRRLESEGNPACTRVVIVNPGFVPETGLARDMGWLGYPLFSTFMPMLMRNKPGVATEDESGAALAQVALNPPEPQLVNGETLPAYVSFGKPVKSSTRSLEKEAAKEMWEYTEKLLESTASARS